MDDYNKELKIFQDIGTSLVSCIKDKQQIQERDEDTLFGELIASELRKIGLPDKLMIKMKINQLIYDHQMRASTAVKDNWERNTSAPNISHTMQSPPIIQGGNLKHGNFTAPHFYTPEGSSTAAAGAQRLFRTSSPDLDNQSTMFSSWSFFPTKNSFLEDLSN